MVALPAFTFPDDKDRRSLSEPEADRWLSLRHAACQLDVSISTVRRWLQKGKLRSQVVTRGRRYAYYVLLPAHLARPDNQRVSSMVEHLRTQLTQRDEELALRDQELRRQEEQIASLSHALARSLKNRQSLRGMSADGGASPYEKYRALVRRRRLWPLR